MAKRRMVSLRLPPEFVTALDRWRASYAQQTGAPISVSNALMMLCRQAGLTVPAAFPVRVEEEGE
jgi:hypothetical protein